MQGDWSPFPERVRIVPPEPGAWPTVVEGGALAPYIDHEVDRFGTRDPGVIGSKVPIAWGTVQGVPWSLTAFMVDGRGDWMGHGGPDGTPGPSRQLLLGAQGDFGGGGLSLFCTTPWTPRDLNLTSMGFGSGPLTMHMGVVSDDVAAVEFRFEDGRVISDPPIQGPPGVNAGYFALWAPNDVGGTVRAVATDGSTLAEYRLHLPAIGHEPDANASTSYG